MTYRMPIPWQEWPDSPVKRVVEKILNSPRVDREKLHQQSLEYQKELLAEWAEEDRLKEQQEK